jgi:hypothetical protein
MKVNTAESAGIFQFYADGANFSGASSAAAIFKPKIKILKMKDMPIL